MSFFLNNSKIIFLLLIITSLLLGCVSPFMYDRHPSDQPGTTWRTEDDKVVFSIKEGSPCGYGYIQTENGNVEIVLGMSMNVSIILVSYADVYFSTLENEPVAHFAKWDTVSVSRDKFVVRVKTTVFLEPGQILTFFKD